MTDLAQTLVIGLALGGLWLLAAVTLILSEGGRGAGNGFHIHLHLHRHDHKHEHKQVTVRMSRADIERLPARADGRRLYGGMWVEQKQLERQTQDAGSDK